MLNGRILVCDKLADMLKEIRVLKAAGIEKIVC
jgi:hypothetical protein